MGLAQTSQHHSKGSSFHKQDTPCKLKGLIVQSLADKTFTDFFFFNMHKMFYRIQCRHTYSKSHETLHVKMC